jgi:hypothetical protein
MLPDDDDDDDDDDNDNLLVFCSFYIITASTIERKT